MSIIRSTNRIWGYRTGGLFQTDAAAAENDLSNLGNNWGAGDVNFLDITGNGIVDPENQTLDNQEIDHNW